MYLKGGHSHLSQHLGCVKTINKTANLCFMTPTPLCTTFPSFFPPQLSHCTVPHKDHTSLVVISNTVVTVRSLGQFYPFNGHQWEKKKNLVQETRARAV